MKNSFNRFYLLILALLAVSLPLPAATVRWVGGSGDWNTAANWNTGLLPGPTDDVVVDTGNNAITVTHSSGSHGVHSLLSQAAFQLTGGTLVVPTTIQVNNTFTISGGTLESATVLPATNSGSTIWNAAVSFHGVTLGGNISWTNGLMGGGSTLTIATNGVLNISGGNILNLLAVLTNAGTVNWGGNARLDIYNNAANGWSGAIVNLPGALFNCQNDQQIRDANPTSPAYFNNFGTVRKTAGTNTLITVAFNNSGLVDVAIGLLTLNGGGTGNGNFTCASNAAVQVASGALFLGGSAQALNLTGGALVGLNAVIGNLTWSAGDLQGSNTLTGIGNWSGGSLGAALTIASNAVLNVTAPGTLNLFGALTNAGTVNWTGPTIASFYNDATRNWNGGIANLLGATFNSQNDQSFLNGSAGSPAAFNNAGAFRKTAGANTLFTLAFNNSGIVNVATGWLSLNGGGTSSGPFACAANAAVTVTNATLTLAGPVDNLILTGSGTVKGLNLTLGNLTWNGGNLNGANTVTGLASWTGGILGNSLTIASNAVLTIAGNNVLNLLGVLTNAGTVNWSGPATLDVYYSAPNAWFGGIVNLAGAVFNSQNDQNIVNVYSGSPAYFNNAGTFRKTAGANTTLTVAFNNTGLLDVVSGMVYLNGGGIDTGSFTATPNASVGVSGGSLTIGGPVQNLILSGGAIFGSNYPIANLTWSSGNLNGANTVTGTALWTGGSLGSALTIGSNAVLTIAGNGVLNLFGVLTNAGTVNWVGPATLQLYNNANTWLGGIVNLAGGLFDSQNNHSILGDTAGGPAYFNNAGLFRKSFGTNTLITAPFNNSGLVDVASGLLALNGGGAGSGNFTAATNAAVNVGSGTLTLSGSAQNLLLTGGTLIGVNATLGNLTWSSGNLQGTNLLTGLGTWSGGSLGDILTIATNAILSLSGAGPLNFFGVLLNAGTVNWGNATQLQLYNGATPGWSGGIINQPGAFFLAQGDETLTNYGTSTSGYFENDGTFRKLAGTNTTIGVNFINNGTADVTSGALTLSGGGMGNGTFTYAPNTALSVAGGTLGLAGTLPNLILSGGTVFATNVTIGSLTWTGGNLQGNSTVTGVANWTGGSLGRGLTIASNAVLNLSGGGVLNFFGGLTNAGTINWAGPATLQLYNIPASGWFGGIANIAGAVFNALDDQTLLNYNSSSTAFFNNAGTLRKSAGTNSTINVPFYNSGLLDVDHGSVTLQSLSNGVGGTLSFALNSLSDYGQLSFASPPDLSSSGTLSAHPEGGYQIHPGDGFVLLHYPSFSGDFGHLALPPQAQWQTLTNANNFTIVAVGNQNLTNVKTWTGSFGADWFNPNNWSPTGVPDGNAGQIINLGGNLVNLSAPVRINGGLKWTGGALTGNPLTISPSGWLSLTANSPKVLQLALTNSGNLLWGGGNLVLSNCVGAAGSLVNSAGALLDIWCDQTILASCSNSPALLENHGLVIKSYGSGSSVFSVPLVNSGGAFSLLQGTLVFNQPATFNGGSLGGTGPIIFNALLQNNSALQITDLTLNLNGACTNVGGINATNANLNLNGALNTTALGVLNTAGGTVALTGILNNRGTTLQIATPSTPWLLKGGTVQGGTVVTTNSATFIVGVIGGFFDGVTLNGTLDIGCTSYNPNWVQLNVLNGLTLNGTALLGNPTNAAIGAVNFFGSQALGGSANVVFGQSPFNTLRLTNAASTLTLSPGVTILGKNGWIGYSPIFGGPTNVNVINQGSIAGDVSPGYLQIGALAFTQQGAIAVINGNSVLVSGPIFLTGLGSLSLQAGGTLGLSGGLTGNTVNSGHFNAAGTLLFNGKGTGSNPQFLEVMGRDLGTSPVGFLHNFAYGSVVFGNQTYVRLIDQYRNSAGTAPEALYTGSLIVPATSTLDLNGLHLYARAAQIGGHVLNGSVTLVPNGGPIALATATLGNLLTAGELDQWTFFARAGQTYTVLVDPGSGTGVAPYLGYAQIQVLNSGGAVLASRTNSANGAPLLLSNVGITNDGTYAVQIQAPPGSLSATGHYNITVWPSTPNVAPLVMNQVVTGDIQTPYSLDQWTFAATAGQQIHFHLVSPPGNGVGFDLVGPTGPLGFTNLTGESPFINLPTTGKYSVTAHSLNGQYGNVYAFQLLQTVQTNLTLGAPYVGQWAGSGQAVLLQFNVPASAPLGIVLNNQVNNNHANIYVGYGYQPTTANFDFCAAVPSSPNQHVIIPIATAGTWYVLLYADNIQTPGGFALQASSSSLLLYSSTPDTAGVNAPINLTLAGAGFDAATVVEFIDAKSYSYPAAAVSVDSFTQLTVSEAAGALPAGVYSLRATSASGAVGILPNAFSVLSNALPNLTTHVSVPGSMGFHQPATIYSQFANSGDAAMPAPLLVVSATGANGRQGALLTTDASQQGRGLWTSAEPLSFGHSVQFLGSGQTPGILQPGESSGLPVYYAGWQQPWDTHAFQWSIGVVQANDPTPLEWASLQESMRPASIPTDAWNAIFATFAAQVGTNWGGYVTMLDDNASYLGRLNLNVSDLSKLLAFQFLQADGLCPLRTLASSVDASVTAPGLPLTFSRMYGERISQRYTLGPFGRGWTHNWQYSMQIADDGTVAIRGPGGTQRVFQPDTRGGWFAQPGDYGKLASAAGTSIYVPLGQSAAGAFTLTEKSGLVYFYQSNGQLGYLQDLNQNRITLGYSGGKLTSLEHSSGATIQLTYTGAGHIHTITDNLRHQTLLSYDPTEQYLVGAQYYDGRTAAYTYNLPSGPIQVLPLSTALNDLHALTGVASSCCNWRYFTYDAYGRLNGTHLANNSEAISFTYGSLLQFQPLATSGATLPLSGGLCTVTDSLTNQTHFYYDHEGQLARTVDAIGNSIHLSYDANYNVVSITDPTGRSYSYTYDAYGNVIRSTDPLAETTQFTFTRAYDRLASVTDARGNPTQYGYDPNGNLDSIAYADGSKETWSYDSLGTPQIWNNRRGKKTFYTFDTDGRITAKYFSDGSVASYSYDTQGNLTNASTYDAQSILLESSTMTYDPSNRLTRITYPGDKFLEFAYYPDGKRSTSLDQLGHQLHYYYDAAGRLQSMTNELNQLVVLYQYDPVGRVGTQILGSGMYTTYHYDSADHLLGLTNALADNTLLSSFQYTYDSRGRRKTMSSLDGNWNFDYDDIDQLTHAVFATATSDISNQNITYIYDAVGNRIQTVENGITNYYTANNLNQYVTVASTNYTFDPDGNLVKEISPNGSYIYSYNDENRLVSMTSPQGYCEYTYDGFGNRSLSTANGTTTRSIIDPIGLGNIVAQYDSNGTLTAHFDYAKGLLSRVNLAGNADRYMFDGSGNVQQLISSTGSVLNSYVYNPFGNLLRNENSTPNLYQFGGRFGVATEVNNMNDMRARDYKPGIGRFQTIDPIGVDGGLNLYCYSLNNSLSYADPSGLDPLQEILDCASACALTAVDVKGLAEDIRSIAKSSGSLNKLLFKPVPPRVTWYRGSLSKAFKGRILIAWDSFQFGWDLGTCINECTKLPPGAFRSPFSPNPCTSVFCTPGPTSTTTFAIDPNQMTGPSGFGASGFLATGSTLPYRIDFENMTNATAPAQQVIIKDQLSPNFDWSTFSIGEIGFGDQIIALRPGSQSFATNLPFSYQGTNFQIQIQFGIDTVSGLVSATFRSIDPTTSLPPPVNIGFLPPEDGTGRGQGHVSFTIRAKASLPTGTQLTNVALISFDNQAQIATDQVDETNPAAGIDLNKVALITLDSAAPASHVLPLPSQVQALQFPVAWTGQDDAGGSGIGSYDIYVSDNGGAWLNWLSGTAATNATFAAKAHHSYAFYSRAHDNAGNVELPHAVADATTTVVANPLLLLTVSPTSANLNVGDTYNTTVTVSNRGSLNLNGVALSNALPAGVTVDGVFYGRGIADIEETFVNWALGNLTTNRGAAMTITATITGGGTWTNQFNVADSDGATSASATQIITVAGQPAITISQAGNQAVLMWPSNTGNYALQSATNLASPTIWTIVTNTPTVIGATNTVTVPIKNAAQFFRLSGQ